MIDLSETPMSINRVIALLEGIKEFRVKGELPFNTCDYYEMDSCMEFLKKVRR